MFTKKFLFVLLILPILTAGCTTTTASPTQAASTPETETTSEPPTEDASALEGCPCFEGLSSGLDNATQARIRVGLSIKGTPRVDVYVNGLPAINGGKLQQNIGQNQFSGWLYTAPGTYSVTLVPHGKTLEEALFEPAEVTAVAGHRYTVAVIGQVQDNDARLLVVDETALEMEAGLHAGANNNTVIVEVNNVKGAPAIDELFDGNPGVTDIPYGGVKAGFCDLDWAHDTTTVTGQPEIILYEGDTYCEPGASFFFPPNNDAPTRITDGSVSQGTSELNVVDFLAGFNSHSINMDGHLATFNTFLEIVDKAGWGDQLTNSEPYFLMAPTDEAFSALSQADLDALLNDPQAMEDLLNTYIVDGYYPAGSLSGAIYGTSNREVMNRLGQTLKIQGDFLNELPIGPFYTVGNGNRVGIIFTLVPTK